MNPAIHLRVKDAATLTEVDPHELRRHIATGHLKARKARDGSTRVTLADIRSLLSLVRLAESQDENYSCTWRTL